jgi:tetratricopeptide (TPR) repeat protein
MKKSRRQETNLPVVDKVRLLIRERDQFQVTQTTQKSLERQASLAIKIKDDAALLEAYYDLANFWEEHENTVNVEKYLVLVVELIERLRGSKSDMTLEDIMPLARVYDFYGRVKEARALFHQTVTSLMSKGNTPTSLLLIVMEKLFDATLRSENLEEAGREIQNLQRLRESTTPANMPWPHPPQGEVYTVEHVEHMRTNVDIGRLRLMQKDWDGARAEFQKVADWREEIRRMGKDWRRADAGVPARVRSLEIVADAMTGLGAAYAGLGRHHTAEKRLLEGLGHWEELIALEEGVAGLRSTCTHVSAEGTHLRHFADAQVRAPPAPWACPRAGPRALRPGRSGPRPCDRRVYRRLLRAAPAL